MSNQTQEQRVGYAIILVLLFSLVGFSFYLGRKSVDRKQGVCRFCGEAIREVAK